MTTKGDIEVYELVINKDESLFLWCEEIQILYIHGGIIAMMKNNDSWMNDEMIFWKKEKDITEQYFAEKNVDCTVTIYQNVEWFLLGLNEEKFDMYILDIRMPGENGIEAAREIRRLYPDPVIYIYYKFLWIMQ